jgi:general secretion pathway protein J
MTASANRIITRCRYTGFTLLEIMVAMLLLSVIITSSVTLLFLNIRGWDALTTDSEKALDESLINERIRGAVRTLSPIVRQTAEGRRLAFIGEPKQLHFVSPAPQQYLPGGLFEYLLREELDSENNNALVLYYTPYRPDVADFVLPDEGEKRTLITDTGGVTFSYFGLAKRAGRPAWRESWESDMETYPQIIKLTLARDQDGFGETGQFIPLLRAVSDKKR